MWRVSYPPTSTMSGYQIFTDETQARIAHARYGGKLERKAGVTWATVATSRRGAC
jgi:hypothetical protein